MPIMETLAIVGGVFKALPSGTTQAIEKSLKQTKDKILGRYESSFSAHLFSTLHKCSEVQTIFTNEKKVPLRSIYTNLYVSGDTKIRDEDIISDIDNLGNIVVSGTGGAGKTMLMKFLALNAIEYPIGRIPLFIELRNLSFDNLTNFHKAVFDYCVDQQQGHDQYTIFREGLRNGLFLIFFDGLDEVPSSHRDEIFNSIKRMARELPRCRIIASSRPEIDTRNWGELKTLHVLGMTSTQAKNLIGKVDFPVSLKNEFINLMDQTFFNKHRSFLSIPLLCSLMLLTYHEYQSIPSRITVFYDQAFETLMRRHDRSKEGFFKRLLECGLSSDRFRLVFAAFCYRTLAKQEVSFSDENFRYHISRAAAATEIQVDVDCYATDLVSHVCAIMRDGLNLHFIHRSFQEYFAAVYLIRYRGGDALALYDRLFQALNVNDVALMAYDLDIQAFEREWALPACRRIKDDLDKVPVHVRPIHLLQSLWFSIVLDKDGKNFRTYSWVSGNLNHDTLSHLTKVYSTESLGLKLHFTGSVNEDSSLHSLLQKFLDPREISDIYVKDDDDGLEDGHVEINIEKYSLDWVKDTSMWGQLERCVEAIYKLNSILEARVSQREMIDLLN